MNSKNPHHLFIPLPIGTVVFSQHIMPHLSQATDDITSFLSQACYKWLPRQNHLIVQVMPIFTIFHLYHSCYLFLRCQDTNLLLQRDSTSLIILSLIHCSLSFAFQTAVTFRQKPPLSGCALHISLSREVELQQEVRLLDPVSIKSSPEASAQLCKYFTGRLHLLLLVQLHNFESFLQTQIFPMVIISLVKNTHLKLKSQPLKMVKALVKVFPCISI